MMGDKDDEAIVPDTCILYAGVTGFLLWGQTRVITPPKHARSHHTQTISMPPSPSPSARPLSQCPPPRSARCSTCSSFHGTSQYEIHLRVPPPIGTTTPKVPSAVMLTLLVSAEFALGAPDAIVYLSGKRERRKGHDATHNDNREL